MKSICTIFICAIIIANCNANPVSQEDLKNKVQELLNYIAVLFQSLEKVKAIVHGTPDKINERISSFDYGISKHELVVQLEYQLLEHRFAKNVTSCRELLDKDLKAVKKIFDFVFWLGANSELEEDDKTLDHVDTALEYISNDLRGTKLEKNLKLCLIEPKECKITIEYPKEIDNAKKSIEKLETLPDSLIDTIINDDFHKQVSDKIKDEVYPEITKCIKNLKQK